MPEARSLLKLFPAELSAELQQRVAVALALMGNPTMIVADDPTRGFDKIVQAQILNLLVEYCTEKHAGMIILSQDMGVAAEVADQLAIMYEGQIVGELDPKKTTVQELGLYMSGAKKDEVKE